MRCAAGAKIVSIYISQTLVEVDYASLGQFNAVSLAVSLAVSHAVGHAP